MSAKSLEDVNQKIAAVQADAKKIQDDWQAYDLQVKESIGDLLKAAGIWDQVNVLELEREEVRKKADERFKALQDKFNQLQTVRNYFLGGSETAASVEQPAADEGDVEATEEVVSAEAPEVVAEVPAEAPSEEATEPPMAEVIQMKAKEVPAEEPSVPAAEPQAPTLKVKRPVPPTF